MRTAAAWLLALALVAATTFAGFAAAQTPALDDETITASVEKAIYSDASLKMMDITVQTRDGVVYLRGFVNSIADITRAAALARTVKGVNFIRNRIRVADRPSRA
jgi:osmotically-inducible protein OsmY